MKVTFLGTGAGKPSAERNTSSLFIEFNRYNILIDVGEATQHQLAKTSIRLSRIDCICITHNHGDHIYGIPGLLNSMSVEGRTETVKFICNNELKELVLHILRVTKSTLNFDIDFIENDNGINIALTKELAIDTFNLSHDVDCKAYRFSISKYNFSPEKLKEFGIQPGPLLGKLSNDGSIVLEDKTITLEMVGDETHRKYVFCGDNDILRVNQKSFVSFCEEADLLVHEATLISEDDNRIFGHSFVGDVFNVLSKANIKHLILNHLSSRHASFLAKDLVKDVYKKKNINLNYTLAEDLLEINFK